MQSAVLSCGHERKAVELAEAHAAKLREHEAEAAAKLAEAEAEHKAGADMNQYLKQI